MREIGGEAVLRPQYLIERLQRPQRHLLLAPAAAADEVAVPLDIRPVPAGNAIVQVRVGHEAELLESLEVAVHGRGVDLRMALADLSGHFLRRGVVARPCQGLENEAALDRHPLATGTELAPDVHVRQLPAPATGLQQERLAPATPPASAAISARTCSKCPGARTFTSMDLGLGVFALLAGAFLLGFRHGIDWDHVAAITDITSTTTTSQATADDRRLVDPMPAHHHHDLQPRGAVEDHPHSHADASPVHVIRESRWAHEQKHALALATLYALGHASVVAALGLAAILLNAVLPDWVDPIMERVVGFTLLVLGAWVLASLVQFLRGKGEFRLRSRWMLVFDGVRFSWGALQARIHGHEHQPSAHATSYGPRTAFGVGMIHGVGAETGTQVLLIASIAGVGNNGLGVLMLAAFLVGLVLSNGAVAVLTASGFITAARQIRIYVAIGSLAGVFSLVIGAYFLFDLAHTLPDLQQIFGFIGG